MSEQEDTTMIMVGTGPLEPSEVIAVARGGAAVALSAEAEPRLAAAWARNFAED